MGGCEGSSQSQTEGAEVAAAELAERQVRWPPVSANGICWKRAAAAASAARRLSPVTGAAHSRTGDSPASHTTLLPAASCTIEYESLYIKKIDLVQEGKSIWYNLSCEKSWLAIFLNMPQHCTNNIGSNYLRNFHIDRLWVTNSNHTKLIMRHSQCHRTERTKIIMRSLLGSWLSYS